MARLNERFAQQARLLDKASVVAPSESGGDANESLKSPSGGGTRAILTELPLEQITPDPNQPRRDLGDLSGLTDSISEVGVVQPIIVTVTGYEAYRIVAGERRYTAAIAAGLTTIPAIVRSVEEQEKLVLQLIENLHRKDLNPFEEAQSYQRLMDEFNFTQKDIAKRLGKTQGSVSEIVRLLDLPPTIQNDYEQSFAESGGRITKSLLLEIARVPVDEQTPLWEAAKRGELTVKQARAEKQAAGQINKNPSSTAKETKAAGFHLQLQTREAVVTVAFVKLEATVEEIISALEEALAKERARVSKP